MHLRQINPGVKLSLLALVACLLSLFPDSVSSRILDLSGLIEVDYNSTTTTTTTKATDEKKGNRNSEFLQRYIINGSGIIIDPKLSSYSASIGITDSVYSSNPAAGESTKLGRNTLTYSLNMSILPTHTPINLFAQRNLIAAENSPDLVSDTYSLGWFATIRTQTTLRATLLQIGTSFDDPVNPRDTKIRIANLGLTQGFSTGSLTANYMYTDYLTSTKDGEINSEVNNYSIRGEDKLSPSLYLSGNITYFPKGSVFTPGITSTAETTGEVGLRHQLERFTQGVDYTFRKSQGGDIKRDTVSYNMNYRPRGKTDYRADALYSATGTSLTDTNEYRISGGINHRPFYGLSITTNMALNHFDVAGVAESRTDRLGAMAGINYYKLFELFNLNSNYSADDSIIFSNQHEAEGSIITQTASIALQTRTLEFAQVLGSYSFLLRNNNIVRTDDRQEQTGRVEAVSTYFRGWSLHASTTFSTVLDYGDTFILDTRAEYFLIPGTTLAGGYRFSNFPGITNSQDTQLYFIEGSHNRYLTRRLSLNLTAHGEREELRSTDRNRVTFTSVLNYQLGKVNINFEFREDYTNYPESVYNVQSYFIKASRPF